MQQAAEGINQTSRPVPISSAELPNCLEWTCTRSVPSHSGLIRYGELTNEALHELLELAHRESGDCIWPNFELKRNGVPITEGLLLISNDLIQRAQQSLMRCPYPD